MAKDQYPLAWEEVYISRNIETNTGEFLQPSYYLGYLQKKYAEVYRL